MVKKKDMVGNFITGNTCPVPLVTKFPKAKKPIYLDIEKNAFACKRRKG